MIVGIGIDVVEIQRMVEALSRHEGRFGERVFTQDERAYCDSHAHPDIHYAARFAAKEACAKALGTGFAGGVGWQDIAVAIDQDTGRPTLMLTGGAQARFALLGGSSAFVSLTHTKSVAAAVVVIEGSDSCSGAT